MTDALRLLNIAAWLGVGVLMVPGAWSALFGRQTRFGDTMQLCVLSTAFIFIAYSIRGLIAPHDEVSRSALQLASIANAIFVGKTARAYGRGSVLSRKNAGGGFA